MAGIGFCFAVIMALILAPGSHRGAARAGTVNPLVAFYDPFHESQPSGYLLGASGGPRSRQPSAAPGAKAAARNPGHDILPFLSGSPGGIFSPLIH
jgi:hypothetical protein